MWRNWESPKKTAGNPGKSGLPPSFHPRWHVETPALEEFPFAMKVFQWFFGIGVIGFFWNKNHYAQIYAALMRPCCRDLSTCKMWSIQILGVWERDFIFRLILSFAGAGGCWFQFWNRWCLCCDIITHLYLHQTEECPGSLWRLWGAVWTFACHFLSQAGQCVKRFRGLHQTIFRFFHI